MQVHDSLSEMTAGICTRLKLTSPSGRASIGLLRRRGSRGSSTKAKHDQWPVALVSARYPHRFLAAIAFQESVADVREEGGWQRTINDAGSSRPGTSRRSGLGQMNALASEITIQDRSPSSPSRPRRVLVVAGISTASSSFSGGVCVMGRTSTCCSLASSTTAITIAQGRSFNPSSHPCSCSRFGVRVGFVQKVALSISDLFKYRTLRS